MKLKLFLTLVLCFLYFSIQAQRGTRIAYIDMDVILSKNKEFRTANQLLDEKITQWKKEVELKKIQLKRLEDQFAVEKILLTPELISDRELEIKDFASEIVSLQEKRFGPKGDMMIQKNQLLKPVQDQVLSIVQDIAKERKYDFVFDRSSDIIMLYSAKNYDISELVLRKIKTQEKDYEKLKNKFESYLSTNDIPDPELVIRSGGEKRISNFYLWQAAYSEFIFTDIFWPDFRKKNLNNAIFEFQKRKRRFGGL